MASPTIVYDFSELREDVHAVETDVEAIQTQISGIDLKLTELVGTSATLTEKHNEQIYLGMLTCGLIAILIGICFVGIFKGR
ncbi:MAG: hypothetical protein J6C96_00520 [Oscillospiraceae bacterium]|nr:hypothetical protein [Oscillospiraceae bacterium]